MKRFYNLLVIIILSGGLNQVFAQNEIDVVRYVATDFSGTARVASMAGAFGSLGGDLSTPLINPAGSGIFSKSEVEITPGAAFYNTNLNVENQDFSDGSGRFVFSNLGYVYSGASKSIKPTYFNFSMGFFRIKDFNFESSSNIINDKSSMLSDFTTQAEGISVEDLPVQVPFSSYLAYYTLLIDEDTTETPSYLTQPRYEENFSGVSQKYDVVENGSMGEMYFNGAVALQEKVYIGLSLGFTFGNFSQKTAFVETTINDSLLLDNFTYVYEQNSSISGINLKLGLIYKPEDWLRLGLAYHIPNQLQLTDEWFTSLHSQFKDGDAKFEKSPDGKIEYAIKNPGKLIVSAAVISGFNGLISFDAEWINYSKSEIVSGEFNFNSENQFISQVLRNAFNFKIGGEIWFGKFNFRGGYAYHQNAYKSLNEKIPDFFNTFALGAGILTKKQFYLNLSGSYKTGNRLQAAYSPAIAPIEQVDTSMLELLVSAGYRF